MKAHIRIVSQDGWAELLFAPKFDLPATCEEISQWYRKQPWATETD